MSESSRVYVGLGGGGGGSKLELILDSASVFWNEFVDRSFTILAPSPNFSSFHKNRFNYQSLAYF